MADDIVDQLRHEAAQCSASPCVGCTNLLAAADEIERLRAHIERLAATHPLASVYTTAPADPTVWIDDEEARRG